MIRIGTFGQTKDVWIMLESTDRLNRNVTAAIPHLYILTTDLNLVATTQYMRKFTDELRTNRN